MDFRQLELKLDECFGEAAETPAIVNLSSLWQQFEPALAELSVQDRLRVGGQVIEQLAGLHQVKAQHLLEEWENAYDPQDPVFSGDWLQGLVRQTQQLDLSELTAPVKRRPSSPSSKRKASQETIVGEVAKENLLDLLEQLEQVQAEAALTIAHEERIQEWVMEIRRWFEGHPEPIALLQLRQALDWPLVQLWLSLLLGGFQLERKGEDFYSPCILVSDR